MKIVVTVVIGDWYIDFKIDRCDFLDIVKKKKKEIDVEVECDDCGSKIVLSDGDHRCGECGVKIER